MTAPATLTPDDSRRMAALRFFAASWGLGWDADYVRRAIQALERYAPEVVEAATTELCRRGGDRPWNPLGTLLEACDGADAKRTARLAPAQMIVPTILGATYDEVRPYARPASQRFEHAELLAIRDEIAARRKEKAPQARWRPKVSDATNGTDARAEAGRAASSDSPLSRGRGGSDA